jgi:hypothetical protein
MGQTPEAEPGTQAEIDAWLRDGGLVVTASDRAARALGAAFHRARRAEGLLAWPAPPPGRQLTFIVASYLAMFIC